jgi:hypothetical protein
MTDQISDFTWGKYRDELVYIVDTAPIVTSIPDILLWITKRRGESLKGIGVIHRNFNGEWNRVLHIKGKYDGMAKISTGSKTEKWKNEIEETLKAEQ